MFKWVVIMAFGLLVSLMGMVVIEAYQRRGNCWRAARLVVVSGFGIIGYGTYRMACRGRWC